MYKTVHVSEFLHRRKDVVNIVPDMEYSLVTVKLHHKGVVLREKKRGSHIGSTMHKICKGQFILSGIDARNGAFGVVPEELDGAIITNDFWCFDVDESVMKRDFFYWLTNTPLFLAACEKSSRGETQRVRLQKDLFFAFEFHIPPVSEQEEFLHRIEQTESGLSALNHEISYQTEKLSQLRQCILQEAIEGKLTAEWRKQNPKLISGENHASKLLERIQSEKEQLIKDGKFRKEKPLPPITDEKLFELPEGWVWCRLGEVNYVERGVSPEYCESSDYKILNQKCVRWGNIDIQWVKSVLQAWWKSLDKASLTNDHDVLVNSTGEGPIGRAGLVTATSAGLPFDTHVLRVRPIKGVVGAFIVNYVNSVFGQNQVTELKGAKTTKQTELGVGNLRSFAFPLPPEKEQIVIEGYVSKLFSMIDTLNHQVSERREKSELLMRSVLQEAFEHSHA